MICFFIKLMVCRMLSVSAVWNRPFSWTPPLSSPFLPSSYPFPEWAPVMAPLTPGTVATRHPLPPTTTALCTLHCALCTQYCTVYSALHCLLSIALCTDHCTVNGALHCVLSIALCTEHCLESFQMAWKVSWCPGKLPDILDSSPSIWPVFTLSRLPYVLIPEKELSFAKKIPGLQKLSR